MEDGSSDERVKRGRLMVNGTLAAEASLLGKVLMTSADHIYMFDPSGRYLFANAAGAAALGLKPADMMGRHWRELGFPRDIMETFADNLRRVMETRRPLTAYTDFPTLEGVRRYEYILTPVVSPSGEVEAVVCDARDMTALPGEGVSEREGDGEEGMRALSLQLMEIQEAERRKIARELHDQVGQTLSIIKVNLQQLSRCPDLETQQVLLDRTIAALGQVLDQIRRISHDLRPSILDDLGLAAALKALMDSEARYRAVVEALEDPVCRWLPDTTLTFANRTYLDLFGLGPGEVGRRRWLDFVPPGEREEVAARYRDLVENPRRFTYEHRVFITGGEERIFYWTDTPLFDPEGRLTEFQSVGRDVTERTRHRAELMRLNERLQRALEGTILAITAAVEVRDPYTAGHQRRTAKLAVDIAREMDLPETVVHGLSLAAEIHDLGKIAVPSEILAKPTRLTETEFALIKTHCESGYRILKDVPFDYPVAEIVYEHHERLDGSGYPRGLRGDETLLESRILAVADVVEAMSSFRPYRPPLGIEAALDEIERKKGILYDGAAVEACLRLFREKGYRLDG
ncbi:MAG TPA: PAS domain-containing protein [Syntrophales bacterium]|mgnify:CR=1 FL=1|nr:PAS domain-containing protein [Syntrophales bacterium]HPC01190.1 PAS domain-containing protein [Syntrophales bacterium]